MLLLTTTHNESDATINNGSGVTLPGYRNLSRLYPHNQSLEATHVDFPPYLKSFKISPIYTFVSDLYTTEKSVAKVFIQSTNFSQKKILKIVANIFFRNTLVKDELI